MTTIEPIEKPTQHGNLRRPRRPGLNNLSLIATGGLLVAILGFILLTTAGAPLLYALVWLFGWMAVIGLLQLRDATGLTAPQRITRRLAHHKGRQLGENLYRAGLIGQIPGRATPLPGLLAKTTLAGGYDSYGREFAVVHHPATGDYVAVFSAEPDGSALVDQWVTNLRVALWAAVLTLMGDEPGLIASSVVIETAPDTGHRLRRAVEQSIEPGTPEIAQAMLREAASTEGSATIRGYITLTFSATVRTGQRKRSTEEVVRDLGSRLPKLAEHLTGTGAGAVRYVAGEELCEVVRTAYDPGAATHIEEARASGEPTELTWDQAGPIATERQWDYYAHDAAVSRTWQMVRPPRGTFQSDVLADLLAPHADITRKRVTLLYETLSGDRAADVVQSDVNDTDFRLNSGPRVSAAIRKDAAAAKKAAEEEAEGAGVVNVGMMITATILDPGLTPGEKPNKRNRTREARMAAALDDAVAAVESLSAAARVKIRPVYGSQDSAFAATLPLGLNLDRHMRLPVEIREAL